MTLYYTFKTRSIIFFYDPAEINCESHSTICDYIISKHINSYKRENFDCRFQQLVITTHYCKTDIIKNTFHKFVCTKWISTAAEWWGWSYDDYVTKRTHLCEISSSEVLLHKLVSNSAANLLIIQNEGSQNQSP